LLYYHPTKSVGANNYELLTTNSVKIFPNPAKTQFTVTNAENSNLYLYNIVGQEVFSTYSKEENTVINVNTFPQGVYVLKGVKEGNVSVHKVVISN
jgi:hypothetical protein